MLSRSILAVLVLPHATTYAHRPPQPSLSQPRSGQPTLKAAGTEAATKRMELLALAKAKPANRVTDIAAGTYSGLVAGFLNCAAVASIVFAPVGLPLSIGVQHALVGFVVTQLAVTRLTGVSALLAVPSFEALPFMARFAVLVSHAIGPDQMPSVLATVLAGSLSVSHPRPQPPASPHPHLPASPPSSSHSAPTFTLARPFPQPFHCHLRPHLGPAAPR